MDAEALRARQAQWARFHEWEARHPHEFDGLSAAWRWYEETWQLAREVGGGGRIVFLRPAEALPVSRTGTGLDQAGPAAYSVYRLMSDESNPALC